MTQKKAFLCGPSVDTIKSNEMTVIGKQVLHERLGHPNFKAVLRTAKDLDIKIKNTISNLKNKCKDSRRAHL